jgi:hypothetical protein
MRDSPVHDYLYDQIEMELINIQHSSLLLRDAI